VRFPGFGVVEQLDHRTRQLSCHELGNGDPLEHAHRARLIDTYMEKVEELVEDSKGKVRADVVHDRLRVMGYEGNERTCGVHLLHRAP